LKCKIQSRRVQGQHTGVAALEEVDGRRVEEWSTTAPLCY